MKRTLLWIVFISLVFLVIGCQIKQDLHQKKTVDGIDISHHNVVRDWDKVKVGFIYAKATEGKSHRDTKFVRFRRNAMKRGIPFGAYHFLSTDAGPLRIEYSYWLLSHFSLNKSKWKSIKLF